MKGLFFSRYVTGLGDGWSAVEPLLRAPPPKGRYHAFEEYPMADYLRVFDHVARQRFPGAPREAYRLLARGEVEVFADSMFGKVVFAMLKDPGAGLLRYPELFHSMTKGPTVSSVREGARHVRVVVERSVGAPEAILGIVEGIVLTFDESPLLDVQLEDDRRFTIDVRW